MNLQFNQEINLYTKSDKILFRTGSLYAEDLSLYIHWWHHFQTKQSDASMKSVNKMCFCILTMNLDYIHHAEEAEIHCAIRVNYSTSNLVCCSFFLASSSTKQFSQVDCGQCKMGNDLMLCAHHKSCIDWIESVCMQMRWNTCYQWLTSI